jgi:hypothetical protein
MRIVAIIMINFIFFMTFQTVDCCYYNKNFLKNLNRSIVSSCNKKALFITNNNDVYNCIIKKENNCNELQNYTEYVNISNNCMKIQREQLFEAEIRLSALIWFGLVIFAIILSGV